MLNKHAYLIMAHNNFNLLEKLVGSLDYEYNDLYVHIDKKVKNFDFSHLRKCVKKSTVYFVKRINVEWGGQSQVLTELLLYKSAYKNGYYSWYHLVSGVDLPLTNAENIYTFFSDKCKSYIYIKPDTSEWDKQRVSRYRFNIKNKRLSNYISSIQEKLHIDRTSKIDVKKGYNWASLTNKSVEVLLNKEMLIKKMTFASLCADEVYKQTILYNFANDTIFYDADGNTTDLRYVDWSSEGNHPKILDEYDYEKILNSGKLFARKFDEVKSKDLINKLMRKINSKASKALEF